MYRYYLDVIRALKDKEVWGDDKGSMGGIGWKLDWDVSVMQDIRATGRQLRLDRRSGPEAIKSDLNYTGEAGSRRRDLQA